MELTFSEVNQQIYQTQNKIKDLVAERSNAIDNVCITYREPDESKRREAEKELSSINEKLTQARRDLQELEDLRDSFYPKENDR